MILQLRKEVPVLAPVLTDERLAAAQLDEDAARELNAEITQLRENHTESFDAFFAAHPEVDHLISVIQANRESEPEDEVHIPQRVT